MGTYLSTPVTEKCQEEGDTGTLSWGVVDMQGWRKGMEDAHVAVNDANIGDAARGHVFAVFDGHGGPEVARFCSLYLVSVLSLQHNEPSKKGEEEKTDAAETSMGSALRSTFHALDRLIDDPTRR
jgi:serine/threonine protein phosphatase PrpC